MTRTPSDAARDGCEPAPRVAAENLEMARDILDAYQRGDDRPLVIGWAVRLASHLLFLSAREEWQLIETAPKDDPKFQAYACHENHDGSWSYYIINRHDVGGRYECWVVPPGRPISPTHWRPLHVPPSLSVKDDR